MFIWVDQRAYNPGSGGSEASRIHRETPDAVCDEMRRFRPGWLISKDGEENREGGLS